MTRRPGVPPSVASTSSALVTTVSAPSPPASARRRRARAIASVAAPSPRMMVSPGRTRSAARAPTACLSRAISAAIPASGGMMARSVRAARASIAGIIVRYQSWAG